MTGILIVSLNRNNNYIYPFIIKTINKLKEHQGYYSIFYSYIFRFILKNKS